jgi:hypothetical protein
MDEKLVPKQKQQQLNYDRDDNTRSNRVFFMMVGAGIGYATIMGMIYIDIHHMNQNLDMIVNLTNDAIAFANANANATELLNVRNSLSEIAECVINKYCRHVPVPS